METYLAADLSANLAHRSTFRSITRRSPRSDLYKKFRTPV